MWCKRERERVSELSTQYTLFSLIYSWCSHIQHFPHGNCGCFQESSTYFVGFSCLADYYFLSPSVDVKYLKKKSWGTQPSWPCWSDWWSSLTQSLHLIYILSQLLLPNRFCLIVVCTLLENAKDMGFNFFSWRNWSSLDIDLWIID